MKNQVSRLALAALSGCAAARAAVVTDGTLGRAGPVTPANRIYSITPALGQTRGPNLFHSFSQFDLAPGETASFTGPPTIKNILARVTGGAASNIDGTIQCTTPNATFYLMNPEGVIFGPSARLDVKGSFSVTTANYARLGASSKFDVSHPAASILSTAPPTAFGFLSPSPAALTILGKLRVPAGKTASVMAEDIKLVGGSIDAPGGTVDVVSAVAGELLQLSEIDDSPMTPSKSTTSSSRIALTNRASIDTDGPGGGRVVMRGQDLSLTDSSISAATFGRENGRGISLRVNGNITVGASAIVTDTSGMGNAGPVHVTAASLTMDGHGSDFTGVASRALRGSSGAAGEIEVDAGTLTMVDGGQLVTSTNGTGAAGNMSINATAVVLRGDSSSAFGTALLADTRSLGRGGPAGDIDIHCGVLRIAGAAGMSVDTFGQGQGGSITIHAAAVSLLGNGISGQTGIVGDSLATGASGRAGDIGIFAGSVTIANAAAITSGTNGSGHGGNVAISAAELLLDGEGSADTSIQTDSIGTGAAGNVHIATKDLTIRDFASIHTQSGGPGAGGFIAVAAKSVLIDGFGASTFDTAISADSSGPGVAGTISISADLLSIINGGVITTLSTAAGGGGKIAVNCRDLYLNGGSADEFSTGLFADSSGSGKAGDISVSTGSLRIFHKATISSTSNEGSTGDGGHISINADDVVLDGQGAGPFNTGIFVSTESSARGGDIALNSASLEIQGGAEVGSGTDATGDGGNVHVKADRILIDGAGGRSTGIGAGSEGRGKAGNIEITASALAVRNGGTVNSNSDAGGDGGDVSIESSSIVVSGRGTDGFFATIAASATGTGSAGNVRLLAEYLRVGPDSAINSVATVAGRGGQIAITAGSVTLMGGAISAANSGTGDAGSVSLNVGDCLSLTASSSISSTADHANAGQIDLRTGSKIQLVDSLIEARAARNAGGVSLSTPGTIALSASRLEAQTLGITSGSRGGNIAVTAGSFTLSESAVSAAASGLGDGGDVSLMASGITTSGISAITAASLGSGRAGNVRIAATGTMTVRQGGTIAATAAMAAGGDVSIAAHALVLDGGMITTETPAAGGNVEVEAHTIQVLKKAKISAGAGDDGNITLAAPHGLLFVRDSVITAHATGAGGGKIVIDPAFVVLEDAIINGLSAQMAVQVKFDRNVLLLQSQSKILTQQLILPPTVDIVGGLLPLPQAYVAADTPLEPQCAARFDESNVSSFILAGGGGQSPVPGGWLPDDATAPGSTRP